MSKLSKEEILDKHEVSGNDFYDIAPVHKAMDEYAKQQSEGFLEWVNIQYWVYSEKTGKWVNEILKSLTTAELYSLYLTTKKP